MGEETARNMTQRISIITTAGLIVIIFLIIPSVSLSAKKTIGIIMTGDIPYYQELHKAFMARLYRERISVSTEVIVQKPYPDAISLSNAARKLIAADVDIIVVYGASAAGSVLQEKTRIPMVFAAAYEPLMSQIKTRNSTGITIKLSISRLLRYLRELTLISTLGVAYNGNEEDSLFQFREISKLAGQYGIKIEGVNLNSHQEAKAKLSGIHIDAMLVTGSSVAHMAMPVISEFVRERKLPLASYFLCRDSHAVITLSTSPVEQGEKAAEKVLKVLEGVSPEKIGIDTAQDVELVFNFKETVSMGWKMPMDLVTEATQLIK
jgi:putative ABC transport system substrate-binding protein